MTINLVPIIVALIGVALFFFSSNAKASRVGEILILAGALAALMTGPHSCTLK